jgi:hypothetical protein
MKLDKKSKPAFGSSFDDFLEEQNMLSEVEALSTKRVLAYQIEESMKEKKITNLNPNKNSYKLKFDDLGEVNEDANPFADIDDVASYAKKLRENSWR